MLVPGSTNRVGILTDEAMRARPCPLCGSDDESRLFAEARLDPSRLDAFAFASRKLPEYMHLRLVACPGCDLLYASPLPSPEALARAYREASFDSGDESRHAARTYGRLLQKVAQPLPDRIGALDIGTGDGAFLAELLAAGFSGVIGVEPSSAPIAAAPEGLRPLIRQGMFRAEEFEPGRLVLLTCFQTLEHVSDPLDIARAAFDLLKPGGAAFFIVHNRRALLAELLGRKSPIFDIEHLQLFSPDSARALMTAAGFERVRVWPIVNRYPLQYWLRLAPLPGASKRAALRFCRRTGLGRLLVPMAVGNLAVVGYKPEANGRAGR